jgi:phage terminase Nu1 subunit (DNA packaging protein)
VSDKKDDNRLVSSAELSKWLGISPGAIENHAANGVIPRAARGKYALQAANLAYCAHLRVAASGRGTRGEKARDRQAAALAEIAEMKLRSMKSEVVAASEVEVEWSRRARGLRAGMLSFVARLGGLLPHLSRSDLALVDSEMRQALADAADGKYDL